MKLRKLSAILTLLMLSGSLALAQGKTFYVSASTGSARSDGLTAEKPMKDLQKAIDAASDDDTILVAEGNYLGSLVENGEYPESDLDILGEIAADISYNNAVRYFKFPLETR